MSQHHWHGGLNIDCGSHVSIELKNTRVLVFHLRHLECAKSDRVEGLRSGCPLSASAGQPLRPNLSQSALRRLNCARTPLAAQYPRDPPGVRRRKPAGLGDGDEIRAAPGEAGLAEFLGEHVGGKPRTGAIAVRKRVDRNPAVMEADQFLSPMVTTTCFGPLNGLFLPHEREDLCK